MGRPLYSNNAATYLAFGITNTATTMQVSANAGSLFPNPTGGDYFYVSLISLSGPIIEIVKCTARSGDIFTIERGQEGTTPLYWNMGDNVQLRITAAGMNYIAGSTASTTLEQSFTATQGQTVFTLTNFDYSPGNNNLAVFVNGSKQVSGTNYTETNVNTVTFTTGLNAGDIVEFLSNLSVAAGTIYATDINYNEGSTGAVTRTLESKLQEFVSVMDFGAFGNGTTNDTAACQAAINAVASAGGGTVYFPPGTYLLNPVSGLDSMSNGLVIPYQSVNSTANHVQLVGEGQSTVLLAGGNNMYIVRFCDSHGGMANISLNANGYTGVSGLGVVPQNQTQLTTLVFQNYNTFQNIYILNCAEGIELKCGPTVSTANSGCWFNNFNNIFIYKCLRGIWLKNATTVGDSGVNRNTFSWIRIGQAPANTGVQIDDGGTNVFNQVHTEGIVSGTSPNATPTAYIINQTGYSGGDNNNNIFNGCIVEANTRDLYVNNAYTEFYGCNFDGAKIVFAKTPSVMLGYVSASYPQIGFGLVQQNNVYLPGIAPQAVYLTYGNLQFPATQNPTTNANILDDYEEGTWTPTLLGGGLSGQTYTTQTGNYLKVGKTVTVWCTVKLASGTIVAGNYTRIGGLPFSSSTMQSVGSLSYSGLTGGTNGQIVACTLGTSASEINIYEQDSNGQPNATGMNTNRLTTSSSFVVTLTYQTTA